jgi:uncharacterized lipoprotein YehR (DUF1307 family)
MSIWLQRTVLTVLAATLVLSLTGCSRRERREVQVHEETREGPVEEERPGEMIVE